MALLELKDVSASYGAIQALFNLSLSVNSGEIVCLIGANGAGKTTAVRTITGTLPITSGEIRFNGEQISGQRSSAIVRAGIACVPEGRRGFPEMTILENLEIGGFITRKDREKSQAIVDYVLDTFPVLKERRNQAAGTLSGGEADGT